MVSPRNVQKHLQALGSCNCLQFPAQKNKWLVLQKKDFKGRNLQSLQLPFKRCVWALKLLPLSAPRATDTTKACPSNNLRPANKKENRLCVLCPCFAHETETNATIPSMARKLFARDVRPEICRTSAGDPAQNLSLWDAFPFLDFMTLFCTIIGTLPSLIFQPCLRGVLRGVSADHPKSFKNESPGDSASRESPVS